MTTLINALHGALLEKVATSNRHERQRAKQRGVPQERRRAILAYLRKANSRAKEPNTRLQHLARLVAPFAVPHANGTKTIVERARGGRLYVATHLGREMQTKSGTRLVPIESLRR